MKRTPLLLLAIALVAVPPLASAVHCGTWRDCLSYTLPTIRTELTTDYSYDAAKLRAGNGGVIFEPYDDPVYGGRGSWVLVDMTFKGMNGQRQSVHHVICQDLNRDNRCDPYREPFLRKTGDTANYYELQNGHGRWGTCTYQNEPIIVLILGADVQSQKVSLATGGSVEAYYGGC